uniref:NADH dehydrogenase [ubiquinone] 1 subunit C2 n=1 Tax=Triatoma infestans TaxID=30076 RepID=A0A161N1C1_TRIIF
MAVSPDPRTLLLPDPEAIPSVLSGTFMPVFLSALGVTAVYGARVATRRPRLSGIQHYVIAALAGALFGKYGQDRYNEYNMDRDAILRHYVELHPEDFPMPERKKVGEIFSSWTPIR